MDGDAAHAHGPSPMEAVLMALCSCTSVDVVSILKKKRQPLTGLRVSAVAEQAEKPPRVFVKIMLTYAVSGKLSRKAVEGRGVAVEEYVLLGVEDAGKVCEDRLRNCLRGWRAGAMTNRPVANFFQVASLVMLLVAVALLSAIVTMHFVVHGVEVQVPALQGMTVADARSQAAGLGLKLDVDNRYYSGDVAAGHILTQSPAAGTMVRGGRPVRVAESLGPQKVDVPDTVGKDQRVATLTLRRVGLEAGTVAQLPWSKGSAGDGAGAGSAGARARNFAAHGQPAGGRAGRRGGRRIRDAGPGWASHCRGAGATGQGGHSDCDADLCAHARGAGGRRRCAAEATGQAGLCDCADSCLGLANLSECHGGADGGGVRSPGVRDQGSDIRDPGPLGCESSFHAASMDESSSSTRS